MSQIQDKQEDQPQEETQETCLCCGGQTYMFQIEGIFGGDFFRDPPSNMYSAKVTCPACLGSGKQRKN